MVKNGMRLDGFRVYLALALCCVTGACKVQIDVPTSGFVTTESGAHDCAGGERCTLNISDVHFDETFVAEPLSGFVFTGWKKKEGSLCPYSTSPCRLVTNGFDEFDVLMAFLDDPEATFYLEPGFRSTGFNALFIGHSFFRPFAEGMPEHAANVGIEQHSQSVVFAGGANGAPEALWNNPAKSAEIKALLDAGDIDLFVMTYHPDYPSFTGYRLWIDYALEQNPGIRIAFALPWTTFPESYDPATYETEWESFRVGQWHQGVDRARANYPDTDIFSIPYGRAAIELRNLLASGELDDVEALTSRTGEAIFRDELGHADQILVDLGRLVWLRAIYDIDLLAYDHDPGYQTDLKSIAQQIMDRHEEQYDAAYR
ncbi:MAG: hypothetical protein AAGF57_15150 [Pseudomonadota bacterium]